MAYDFNDITAEISSASSTPNYDRYRLFDMSDLAALPEPDWLIRDLLHDLQIGLVYAEPGSFKSFLVLDLCSRLVHGMDWQGRPLKPRNVVYVAGEGAAMFHRRRSAWFKHHGMEPVNDGLKVIRNAINLTDCDDVVEFIRRMKPVANLGLVVFDTFRPVLPGRMKAIRW